MRKLSGVLFALFSMTGAIHAADTPQKLTRVSPLSDTFTGKVTRNRVRMRTSADLGSPVLKELAQGELVGVLGEEDVFYAVKPPKDIKAYIYRTYVLDNVVDGAQVNVRLEPSLESPIIAQLNKGDRVEGKISEQSPQWLEISLPSHVKFYIAKDYIEKTGPAELYEKVQKRREEANWILKEALVLGQAELQKAPEMMQLDGVIADLKQVINNYADVPEAAQKAQTYLATVESVYQKKPLIEDAPVAADTVLVVEDKQQPSSSETLAAWLPKESKLFEDWLQEHPQGTMDDFYADQKAEAQQLRGVIQPYNRPVKNRPGNYMLVNQQDNQPIAFLYSTQVDLKNSTGQLVTVQASPRPNNNFACPTYFVLSTQ